MKDKKLAKALREHIDMIRNQRDELLSRGDLRPFEKEDLRDFNEDILALTRTHNYFTAPQDHI